MTGYCHECKFYKENESSRLMGECTSEDVNEHNELNIDGAGVYLEEGEHMVGMNFGCIHFEQSEEDSYDDYDNEEDGW